MSGLAMGMPALDPAPDLSLARATLRAYTATDTEQASVVERILAFIDAHPRDAHERTCLEGHLTASCLLVDRQRGRALLTLHKKLGRWLQFGGHCDGDANLRGTAWRETLEESGITPLAISEQPIDVDIHAIPSRPGEPEHLHLDTRYLAEAPPGAMPRVSSESIELAWFGPHETDGLELDASLERLFRIAFSD